MLKFVLKISATAALCAALYVAADWRSVGRQLADVDGRLFAMAMALFVPQTLIAGWRWRRMVRPYASLGLPEASGQILGGSSANLVLPSRLGDFSKAAMIRGIDGRARKKVAGLVVVEKVCDVCVVLTAVVLAMLGEGAAIAVFSLGVAACLATYLPDSRQMTPERRSGLTLVGGSIVLWTFHLAQLHLFVLCCGVNVPWTTSLEKIPLALVAGLVPAAFCGIGTRDAALVWLFADVAPAAQMAAVGVLTALRYLIPGAAGIPFWWMARGNRKSDAGDASVGNAHALNDIGGVPSGPHRDARNAEAALESI
jgi:glycosyltransferase 2 family protein